MTTFKVCTISGSMRASDMMLKAASQLSVQGWIVLMPFVTFEPGAEQTSVTKRMLDEMHFAKIDMSDRVFVISNADGYYGESTRNEIAYARDAETPISFWRGASVAAGFIDWDGEL